jgi:tetratricopeptide (TPR) repeat protein
MDEQNVAGRRLVELARPYLERGDRDGLARRLAADWSPDCLVLLLGIEDEQAVEVAAVGLGLIGNMAACPSVARLLHHRRPSIVEAAEEALWSIWFLAGGPRAQAVLSRIALSVERQETENTVLLLSNLIRSHPSYAEAYHQRSQVYYLQGSFDASLRDAESAFELNAWHFGALANQAHALGSLGRFQDALRTYRAVLRLHPRMAGIRQAIHHLRERLEPVGL